MSEGAIRACSGCGAALVRRPGERLSKWLNRRACGNPCRQLVLRRRHAEHCAQRVAAQAASFWDRVDRSAGPDACWPWREKKTPNGYGVFHIAGRSRIAHRYAKEQDLGHPIPTDKVAAHSCDNRPCCNPRHIEVCGQSKNIRDCVSRGRYHYTRGTAHGNARIVDDDVRRIRALAASGLSSYRIHDLVPAVSARHIRDIVSRKRWAHVG